MEAVGPLPPEARRAVSPVDRSMPGAAPYWRHDDEVVRGHSPRPRGPSGWRPAPAA
uniref:Uncharacterized protein n=1 Tax=Arundo donax TaxID=35708 RepID=A0A0A9AE22_ARUDO